MGGFINARFPACPINICVRPQSSNQILCLTKSVLEQDWPELAYKFSYNFIENQMGKEGEEGGERRRGWGGGVELKVGGSGVGGVEREGGLEEGGE